MREIITAYLRKDGDGINPDDLGNVDLSLDVFDFDSWECMKRARKRGGQIEFGKYDAGTRSVQVVITHPEKIEKKLKLLPESQEEWDKKRAWYLKHGNCVNTLKRGLSEGYLIDGNWGDWINFPDAIQDLQNLRLEDIATDILYWDWKDEQSGRELRKEIPNVQAFLKQDTKLSYDLIRKARKLRVDVSSEKPWAIREFRKMGFKSPRGLSGAEEDAYVLDTLERFCMITERQLRRIPKNLLKHLVKDCKLDRGLAKRATENPWEVYEVLKEEYCARADSREDYDRRLEEVVFALGV